jgi:hypothetical protein
MSSTNAIRPAVKVSTNPIFARRPFLGFGSAHDVTDIDWNPESRFVFWRDRQAFTDWQVDPVIAKHRIPHGNRTVYQNIGQGPSTLETGLWFRSRIDYQAFLSIAGTAGVLRMNRDYTMHEPDAIVTRFGHQYADFHNVVVTKISRQTFDNDGGVRCEVTFERAEGASSYYGFAYYAGPDE